MSSAKRVLDIDLGNSAMKYRCGNVRGRLDYRQASSARNRLPEFVLPDLSVVARVRVSSVLDAQRNAALSGAVRQRWGIDCEFARSVAYAAGVTNGYTDPEALGVDRWLAVMAAYNQIRRSVLVADLGTAATLDYVTAQGQHLGGFILPGTQLMRQSLLRDTAAVRYVPDEGLSNLLPGRQTSDAVERGVLLSLVQLVTAELERFVRLCDDNSCLVLCGGDAIGVSSQLECEHKVIPDLVLDGLALALPEVASH